MIRHKHKPRHKTNNQKVIKAAISALLAIELIAVFGFLALQIYHDEKVHRPNSSTGISADEPLNVPSTKTTTQATTVTNSPHDYVFPPITNGLAPVLSHILTKQNVVFLGIDDGATKQPSELQTMKDNSVKASLFLTYRFIKDNPIFFTGFLSEGSLIEDHTQDHKLLSQLSYQDQKQEICGEADLLKQLYGRRPVFLRPPGGDYNTDTQKAAADCGMKAVIMWNAKANGGFMQYQEGHQLRPGDIVLMHFRPEFKQDMQSFIDAEKKAGLHTELLENWLPS